MELPLLGIGTWGMGGKFERDESNVDASIELLRCGFDLGMSLVDVAEIYGAGLTEEILGRALKGRKREDIIIVSKVWKEHLRYDDVLRAAEGSLKRLDTPYIDLYLIHWPNPDVPLKETMRALETLRERGAIRHIGVSNFSAELCREAQSYLAHTALEANEIEYNVAAREAEAELIPYCREHALRLIAYRPLGKGKLLATESGVLQTLAKKYEKTPAQVALNWIVRQGISAIPKAGNPEHLRENLGALGWAMTDEDAGILTSHF